MHKVYPDIKFRAIGDNVRRVLNPSGRYLTTETGFMPVGIPVGIPVMADGYENRHY